MNDQDAKTVFDNGQPAMARLIQAETIASGRNRPRGDELTTLVMLFTAVAFSALAGRLR